MAVKINSKQELIGRTVVSRVNVQNPSTYTVVGVVEECGFFIAICKSSDGDGITLMSSSLEGLAVKVWNAK